MRKRHDQVRPEMECTLLILLHEAFIFHSLSGHEMDVRNLSFQAESFDVTIDKGAPYHNPMLNIFVTFGRNNGCHDDSKGRCLGKSKIFLWIISAYIGATQDPPQQVVDDCTKEVDEALRSAQEPIATFLTLSNILTLESSEKAAFSSTWPLDSLTSVGVF